MAGQDKRKALAELAVALREQLGVGNDIEVVLVVSSTDGEFVGVSSNVPVERAEAIMRAACTRDDHQGHPELI